MVLISEITDEGLNGEKEKPQEEKVITVEQEKGAKSSENMEKSTNDSAKEKGTPTVEPSEVNGTIVENPASPPGTEPSPSEGALAGPEVYNEYALRIAYIMRNYLGMQQAAAAGAAPASAPTDSGATGTATPPKPSSSEESPAGDRCKAMMEVVHREPGKWVVSKLILEHNHPITLSQQPGCDTLPTPVMGMEFDSVEAAKTFYYNFSEQNGFKPRTGSNRRSAGNGALIMQRFLCWRGNYLMYRKPSDATTSTRKRKRGPYKSRGGKPYEFRMKDGDVVEVVDVDSSSERAVPAGDDHGALEVESSPPAKEAEPMVVDGGRTDSPPVIGTMLWGSDGGKGRDSGKATQVASTETSRLLRELGVRVYRYTNEERRDIIMKYMMKRSNRQVPDRPVKYTNEERRDIIMKYMMKRKNRQVPERLTKLTARRALAEKRQRGIGGKFLSKDEMQASNKQGEETTADSDDTTVDVATTGGEPKVGMVFKNEDKAYEFYVKYAGSVGFSVRKGWWDKSSRNVTRSRAYVCSREGFRPNNPVNDGKKPRTETRTGCPARMTIKVTPTGKYEVTEFVPDHNHELAAPLDIQMSCSQRSLAKSPADSPQNVHLIPADYKNYLRSKRMKDMRTGDAWALMQYLQKMKGDNPSFFYAMQVDLDDQLTSIIWCDVNSQLDYHYFGDVLCFDTTYKINGYGRPFALFLGVNHHKQIVIFAAALLYDETIESFKWLFETFKAAMGGKQPKTILMDQCSAMSDAIAAVWPGTVHRLCAWHVYEDALKHLSNFFQVSETFAHDLERCIFELEEEEEFLSAWGSMLDKYDLKNNEYLTKLYDDRDKWSFAFGRETFCADIGNVLRKETYICLLKEYLSSERDLLEFFQQFDKLVDERRHAEREADCHASQGNPRLPPLRMLWQAANAYTPVVFDSFRVEFGFFMNCTIYACGEIGTISEYEVTAKERAKGQCVRFDSSDATMSCTCKKFEFVGIPCCHALKVLDFRNIKELPSHYILKRWSKDAKTVSIRESPRFAFDDDGSNSSLAKRYNSLCRILYKIAARAAENLEAYSFLENQSDHLLEEVERILQTRLLEKPSPASGAKSHKQTENDENSEAQRLSGKKKKDGSVRRKNQSELEINKKQKAKNGHSKEVEVSQRDNQSMMGSENIPSHLRNPSSQFFPSNQFMQGPYVPHQFGRSSLQGFHGMVQFNQLQEPSATALQQQPFNGQLNQPSPAPNMNSLQFVGGSPQMDHQGSDQGNYAIPVWDFL